MLPFLLRRCHFLFSPSPLSASLLSSVPFEVLNNKREPHSLFSSRGDPSWSSTAQRSAAVSFGGWGWRWRHQKWGRRAVTITVSAQSLHPPSCQLTRSAQHGWMLKLMSKPVSVASTAETWQLSASFRGFQWDYEAMIMEPFYAREQALLCFFFFFWFRVSP